MAISAEHGQNLQSFTGNGDVSKMSEKISNETQNSKQTNMAVELGGIFIVPYILWHETSVNTVSSKGPSCLITF